MRRDKADRLYSIVINRFHNEKPERKLTPSEMARIWYAIYGKLCRGETEAEVENYCNTAPLN